MTDPQPLPRRSLQARLALFYAAGIYVGGIVVLAIVTVPLVGIQSTASVDSQAPGPITGTGNGIGPHQLLVGSAVALAILIPIALAAGNLHQRLNLGEPADELTELGHILDDLFARLQASFDAQRHFAANASHELRTPLAGLRTLLEVALADPDTDADTLRSACQEALALGGHQERLVRALLALATSERGLTRRDTLDLAQVATGVLASRRDQATQRGIDLADHLAPAVTAGDPRLAESLIANLIDNAIRHNHPNGHVEITTETSGTQATLTITNSGPVIPDNQIQRPLPTLPETGARPSQPPRRLRSRPRPRQRRRPGPPRHPHHQRTPRRGLAITVRFAHPSHPNPQHQRDNYAERAT